MKKIFLFMALCLTTVFAAKAADALSGKFTINDNGDQIVFSKGNLQATTTDFGAHWTWAFATNQWDTIGNAAANNAINGNGTVSTNGTVDLFGWSTNATYFGINKSKTDADYAGDFKEWGDNIPGGWRTLSKAEWWYLFQKRTKAEELFGMGTVNGVHGVIIVPDDWTLPEGAIFNTAKDKNLVWEVQGYHYRNHNNDNFNHNTYTGKKWSDMESAGAVFLPATGYRRNFSDAVYVYQVGSESCYWSSTWIWDEDSYFSGNPPKPGPEVSAMYISWGDLNMHWSSGRNEGNPVRLVKAAPSGATALDQTNEEMRKCENAKIIRNGQLLIERDGKTYTVQGQEVK